MQKCPTFVCVLCGIYIYACIYSACLLYDFDVIYNGDNFPKLLEPLLQKSPAFLGLSCWRDPGIYSVFESWPAHSAGCE